MSTNGKRERVPLEQVIEAHTISEQELLAHAERIEHRLVNDKDMPESERKHLGNLAKKYAEAAHTTGILRKYQEGRLRRRARGTAERVAAHIDE